MLAAGLGLGCGAPSGRDTSYACPDCNVLLISIDTLRADHLSVYGYRRPTTPFLEELSAAAVVFDDMVNNGGGTLPVHMSMMTSLPPAVHGVTPRSKRVLAPQHTTLAEMLQERGYQTAAFTDSGWVRARFGFGQGFDRFDDSGGRFARILPKARRWLSDREPSPFFLFLHTFDTHSEFRDQPYDCPGGYPELYTTESESGFSGCMHGKCASELLLWFNEQMRSDGDFDLGDYLDESDLRLVEARYDGCINYVDAQLRDFLGWLQNAGLYDSTLIIITSDHGEEFLEHGRLLHQNKPFEVLVRVPLLIKFPDSKFGGSRVPFLSSTIDLMPTVLDVLGLESSPQAQGVSLVPTLVERRPVRRHASIYASIRTDRWKFIPIREGSLLYDLANDPQESRNVIEAHPELVERLAEESRRVTATHRRLFEAFQQDPSAERFELTQEEIDELRSLGYVQ